MSGLPMIFSSSRVKSCFVDLPLDLLPGQPAAGLEAEDILRLAAGQGFLPDADRGPDADIALPHGKFFF